MLVRNDSDLFDLIQRLFGCGDYVEEDGAPWWKYRMGEVSKIKRSRLSRGVALVDLATAAHYCKAHGIVIQNFTWLYPHILPALKWQVKQDQVEAQRYLAEELERATGIEFARDSFWFERLTRAEDVAFVLSEWRAAGRDTGRST